MATESAASIAIMSEITCNMTMQQRSPRYIFSNLSWDFLFLLIPALIFVGVISTFSLSGSDSAILAFLIFVAFDTGHSMYTFVRMSTIQGEWRSSKRYFIMPVIFFLIILLWSETDIPYLFSFVVYYSAYHYMRQHWGILRWYEKINDDRKSWRKFFLYACFIVPFVAFHFKNPSVKGIYSQRDFIVFPNENLFLIFSILSGALLAIWIFKEIKNKTTKKNPGLWIALGQLLIHNGAMIFGANTWQVFGPLIAMHSISYFLLTQKVYEKNVSEKYQLKWIFGVGIAILCLAYPFRWLEAYQENIEWLSWLDGFIVALVVTPGLVHYHFDAFLWRHSHPSFARVLGNKP